jgi:hypothetical protein
MIVCVDDLVIAWNNEELISKVKPDLNKSFEMRDLWTFSLLSWLESLAN